MVILLVSVVMALALSFLCSLLEACALSLTPGQVAELTRTHPRMGKLWQHFKTNIERPIAVILIVNTAAHTVGATIAGAQFEHAFGAAGILWFSLLFTYLMLQFTEILPKTLGVRHNARVAVVAAYPLWLLTRALAPVIWLIHLVNRPFERQKADGAPATLEEITALAGLARLSNLIGSHQERIIRGASDLSERSVGDVMIPADQVVFLSASKSLMDAIVAAHLDPHTRFPVHEGDDRDRVLGYVNFKEMIYRARTNPNDHSLRGIIRPVHFTTPDVPAAQLLRVFIDQHEHVAIVRDAQGRTMGLVTLEDLIEELVGELEDEFDRLPRLLHSLSGGVWMVGGGVPVQELASRLGVQLPDATGTTSAWLIRRMGRLPRSGEQHREGDAEFTVRRTRRGRIFEVAVCLTRGSCPPAVPPAPKEIAP